MASQQTAPKPEITAYVAANIERRFPGTRDLIRRSRMTRSISDLATLLDRVTFLRREQELERVH